LVAIIAVPTGIVSAELAIGTRLTKVSTQCCMQCSAEVHVPMPNTANTAAPNSEIYSAVDLSPANTFNWACIYAASMMA
jgi:nitrous oxide reductase